MINPIFIEKNIISAIRNNVALTLATGVWTKIPLPNSVIVGEKLTYNSSLSRIIIGKGIKRIKISFSYLLEWGTPKQNPGLVSVYKNGVALRLLRYGYTKTDTDELGVSSNEILLDVNENDYFELYHYVTTAISNKNITAVLTIEVVE